MHSAELPADAFIAQTMPEMAVTDCHCDLSAVRDVPLAGADQQGARLKPEMRLNVSADLDAAIHSSRFGCKAIKVGSLFGCLG
jgi:hypothetical protein